MGYGRALLMRDVKDEEEAFQKKVKKKSLWGSIGRTLGGLGAMAITGGVANPLTVGLISGGASFLGGAIGASTLGGGKLTGGRFFQSDRKSLQKELGAFGTQNLVSSLRSGITAGIGQKLKLMRSGETAAKFGKLDFKDSFIGKGIEKRAIGKELMKAGEESIGTADKTLQVGKGKFITGGDRAGMVLPDGTSIGSGKTSIPRGQMSEGGISRLKDSLEKEALLRRSKMSTSTYRGPRGQIVDPKPFADLESTYGSPLYGPDKGNLPSSIGYGQGEYETAEASKYLKSLERTNVLEPLSDEKVQPVVGTGQGTDQDIMGSLLEGYNTPPGQGYDPGDEIYRQQNRGAFMDELELDKSLDKRLGNTFALDLQESVELRDRLGLGAGNIYKNKWR